MTFEKGLRGGRKTEHFKRKQKQKHLENEKLLFEQVKVNERGKKKQKNYK